MDRGIPQANEWLRLLMVSWSFRLATLSVLNRVRESFQHRFPHVPVRRPPQQWVERVAWPPAAASLVMASDYLDARSLQAFVWATATTYQGLRMALGSQGIVRCLTRGR